MWVRVPPPAPEKGKSEQDFPFSGAAPSARFDPLRSNAKGDSHPLSRSPHADLKAGSDLDCLGAPRPCGKGNRPACVPAAASLYRGYLSCVPSILLSVAVLPEKASCTIPAACSGVGTLPRLRDILSRSGSLRYFPGRGIPFRTVIRFSRCCSPMNYSKSTPKRPPAPYIHKVGNCPGKFSVSTLSELW